MGEIATADKTPVELLATPVQFLKGVGPARDERLARLELRTVRDVLFFFPRDYEDLSNVCSIEHLVENEPVSVLGRVEEVEERVLGPGRIVVSILVEVEPVVGRPARPSRAGGLFADENHRPRYRRVAGNGLRAVWFNQSYMQGRFRRGQRLMLSGKPRLRGVTWQMTHPRTKQLSEDEPQPQGEVLPVYQLTEGVNQTQMRRIVRDAVERFAGVVDEVFPRDYLESHQLMSIHEALRQIHFPQDRRTLEQARRRFIYQELLIMQLALGMRRWWLTRNRPAAEMPATPQIDARIRRLFPFELTEDQNQAIREISEDMARSWPMNRLLQGDVGTGKTIVAEYAILLAVAHGYQAAVMAPTEVLAQQHARTLSRNLQHSRVRLELLTGSLTERQKRQTLERIAAGQADVVVGTQAIVQSDVQFARLGLVVIDEQHKFGVRQRARLRSAGIEPHYLVMTATPIPRTVSMTLFGDLEISTLRRGPASRQQVFSYLADDSQRARWWDFFRKKLREGRQGYVVTPLVEEAERPPASSPETPSPEIPSPEIPPPQPNEVFEDLEDVLIESDLEPDERPLPRSVLEVFEALANGELEEFRLDLIHGRMSAAEKQAAMERFRCGDTQVLVATSVVEVGIDVPNATLMTIESGERFGLAQLHQLRGRISRGSHPGFLCVFANPQTPESRERLEAFTRTTDGFELAELDFRMRGPGDLFGTRQHGLPPLRIADLARDNELLETARRDAAALLPGQSGLTAPQFERLFRMALRRYGKALDLGDVG